MRKAISHTATVRGQFHADEKSVLYFTGMTLNQLTDLKMDSGREWLMKYAVGNAGLSELHAAELWMEPELLQWWNLEWRRRDHFNILPILHLIGEEKRKEAYVTMHGGVFLSKHPNYRAMELTLMRVVARMKRETNAAGAAVITE